MEDIKRYGLTSFKVKVSGDRDADEARTPHRSIIPERGDPRRQRPVRGPVLADALDALATAGGTDVLDGLVSIEQPVSASGLDPETAPASPASPSAPVIIDEADAALDRSRADLGYEGVSMAARASAALLSRARIDVTGAASSPPRISPTCRPAAAPGPRRGLRARLPHVERNGITTSAGACSRGRASRLVQRHPDLFTSEAHLRIEAGELQLGSLDRHGFGTDLLPAPDASEVVP